MPTTVPTWLDEKTEIKTPDQPEEYKKLDDNKKALAFILLSFKCLYFAKPNMTCYQVLGVTSNSIVETGWGKYFRGFNFGGWKINKSFVEAYKQSHGGSSPYWWKAKGHTNSGDDPVVYYRGFPEGPSVFYKEWMEKFVPENAGSKHRYQKTGLAFWSKPTDGTAWFRELCLAGYKGEVTRQHPEASIQTHLQIESRTKKMFAQFMFGLGVDGIWGPKSTEACKTFQKQNTLTDSGVMDDLTFQKLMDKWKTEGMKQSVDCFKF